MASPLFLRGTPLLRLRRSSAVRFFASVGRPSFPTDTLFSQPPQDDNAVCSGPESIATVRSTKETQKKPFPFESPNYRQWKDREAEILEDIDPVTLLVKEILHSDRYLDGERLSSDDEKVVVEKLLAYHPHSEDKIGPGLDSIMVDRHPQFKQSRCLFVVRTDGGWIDFSYQKCLQAYIRDKYPSYAEKFIRAHYKRGS